MILRVIPILPALLMTLTAPVRRWRLGAAVFGVALAATSAVVLSRVPALSHAQPSAAESALRLTLALGCGLASARCALRLTQVFGRVRPDRAMPLEQLEPAVAKS